MNKRGQIYILVAILFGFTLFILTSKLNFAGERGIEDDFRELSGNYAIESSKFMNSILEKEAQNVDKKFADFTEDFSDFAKTQNPDFGLIFLLPYKGVLYIGNYLDSAIEVDKRSLNGCGGFSKASINVDNADFEVTWDPLDVGDSEGCKGWVSLRDKLNIIVGKISYEFEVNQKVPEVIILSKEDKQEQRKVFMNSKIIKGEIVE